MEFVKQLLLALGLMGSPVDHPPEPCVDHCQVSDVGRALIRNFEGYSPLRYRDSAGLWTIGVGHLIRPGERFDEPLLGDAAEALFQQDLAPKVAAVNARVSVPLFQGQFDAVVSWTYNLGEGALKSSTMLKKINAARHDEVPGQMKRWNKAGGKVVRDLERRREAEAALYELRWY
jgi:lysozyme